MWQFIEPQENNQIATTALQQLRCNNCTVFRIGLDLIYISSVDTLLAKRKWAGFKCWLSSKKFQHLKTLSVKHLSVDWYSHQCILYVNIRKICKLIILLLNLNWKLIAQRMNNIHWICLLWWRWWRLEWWWWWFHLGELKACDGGVWEKKAGTSSVKITRM